MSQGRRTKDEDEDERVEQDGCGRCPGCARWRGVRRVRKARRVPAARGIMVRRARHPDEARVRMSMLKIARWIVAAAAVGALVYATVPMPSRARARTPRASGLTCPAGAKKANLDFTVSDMNGQKVRPVVVQGQGARPRLLGHVVPAVQGGDPRLCRAAAGLRRKRPAVRGGVGGRHAATSSSPSPPSSR